ncbi:MAG: MFS transporter [Coriobacteriia bacterium]|nr:MFS transporter [Coriobacteriia bacterium]
MRIIQPLRSRQYRALWIAQLVSVLGDKIHQIGASILVYKLTGSVVHVGAMLAVTTLPAVLFALPIGAAVDRSDRKRVMVGADVIRAVLVCAIPFLAQRNIAFFYAAAFVVSTASLFFEPARFSLVPEIVAEDDLVAANSLDQATMSVSEIAGLAIGAGLVARLGASNAFFIDASTFAVSALVIASMRVPRRAAGEASAAGPMLAQIADGLRGIRDNALIRPLTATYALAAVPIAAANTAMHGLALKHFGSGPVDGRAVGLAALDAAITVGLLVGSVAVGQSGSERSGIKYIIGLAAAGVFIAATATSRSLVMALPFVFLVGFANMWFYVPARAMVQAHASARHLGRIYAVQRMLAGAALATGYVLAGILVQRIGVPASLAVIGTSMVCVSIAGWTQEPLRHA